jgi:osmotically inducible protein OsmC
MAAERTAEVTWEGDLAKGRGRFTAGSGALGEQEVTWASRTERSEGRTSPEELIAAAHASCFAMALSHGLAEAGNPPERLVISAAVTIDPGAGGITTSKLRVNGRVPGLDATGFEEAAAAAKDGCPVSGALKGNVEITLDATLDES